MQLEVFVLLLELNHTNINTNHSTLLINYFNERLLFEMLCVKQNSLKINGFFSCSLINNVCFLCSHIISTWQLAVWSFRNFNFLIQIVNIDVLIQREGMIENY